MKKISLVFEFLDEETNCRLSTVGDDGTVACTHDYDNYVDLVHYGQAHIIQIVEAALLDALVREILGRSFTTKHDS